MMEKKSVHYIWVGTWEKSTLSIITVNTEAFQVHGQKSSLVKTEQMILHSSKGKSLQIQEM